MGSQAANTALIEAANALTEAAKNFTGDPSDRMKLLRQTDNLRLAIESPYDVVMKQVEMSNLMAALNLLVETGAYAKIPFEGSISVTDLASQVNVEKSAIARSLRLAVMNGIGVEVEPDVFAHNHKSGAFVGGGLVDIFRIAVEHVVPYLKLPEYFKTHNEEDLFDLKKSPFAYGVGLEGMTYYEAISHDQERFNKFNATMAAMEQSIPVLGMYPWASIKEQVEKEPERPYIVDIGGGRGHALVSLQKEAPAGFGAKLILQDRPDVIESIAADDLPNIEKMAYDFFTPQPIKNAHLYLLRRIIHDFYEPVSIKILRQVADAMGPSSRLIIADMIRPEKTQVGGDMSIYWMDFSMMMLNGKEKSEKEFTEILGAVGLEIAKIWPASFGTQAMIECKLK